MVDIDRKIAHAVGVRSENDRVRLVLLHRPGIEARLLGLHPPSALWKGPTNVDVAIEEHEHFQHMLEESGARVLLLRELLEATPREELVQLAERRLAYTGKGMMNKSSARKTGDTNYDAAQIKKDVLAVASTTSLVDYTVLNNRVQWDGDRARDGAYRPASIRSKACGNLLFCRDQMITTDKGVVLGRMRKEQRAAEVDIMEVALKTAGIAPIYRVQGNGERGFLEGGDFIPFGSYALIGVGARTDITAVQELLRADVFGYDIVCTVYDPTSNQDTMHLDTYFSSLGERTVGVMQSKIKGRQPPQVSVYERRAGRFVERPTRTLPLQSFLDEVGMRVALASDTDQEMFALNSLNIGLEKNMAHNISRDFSDAILTADSNIRFIDVPYTQINQMYGSHHCTSQVLYRN